MEGLLDQRPATDNNNGTAGMHRYVHCGSKQRPRGRLISGGGWDFCFIFCSVNSGVIIGSILQRRGEEKKSVS